MHSWKVPKEDGGERLVSFLKKKLQDKFSARTIKRAIEKNLCLVNRKVERFASFRLRLGDAVAIDVEAIEPEKKFTVEQERILYHDEALLFYNKPAWLSSDENGLAALFDQLFVVHRLDTETTGVILFAKTKEARDYLLEAFKLRKVRKEYLALVDGQVIPTKGIRKSYLGKISEEEALPRFHSTSSKKGKFAITSWEVVKQGKTAAMVKCTPETGRTHQIRVHLNELGHPILGDYRYAKHYFCRYHAKRCLLHAHSLSVVHPLTRKEIFVEAPLPRDFEEAIEDLL